MCGNSKQLVGKIPMSVDIEAIAKILIVIDHFRARTNEIRLSIGYLFLENILRKMMPWLKLWGENGLTKFLPL